jgi:hypothetical protein
MATARFKQGDHVSVVARNQTAADVKSGLYYPHFANLTGSILKVYGEEASVLVDRETLPEGIRKRHEQNEKAERTKYLDRLSDEARNRMGEKEKAFSLQYAVLVSLADLKPSKAAPEKRVSATDLDAAEEEFLKARK